MTAKTPHTICLLRLSAIGDTCNVVPTVRQLQATFPNSKITWIIGAVEHRLLGTLPDIEFITVNKSGDRQEGAKLRKQLSSRRFDVLLHMHASMRANLLSRNIKASRKIGFDRERARDFQWLFCNERIPARKRAHVVEGFLQFAEQLGAAPQAPVWDLPIDAGAQRFATEKVPAPSLLISPCSSDRRKNFRNWSVKNYVALAQFARGRGLTVVLTGGKTSIEHDYGQRIAAAAEVTNLIGETSLPELLALIKQARVVVCPDSGPAHMANAVGTPVVGLFATSNRWRTGPYLSQDFAADRYPDALDRFMHTSVDRVRWGQRVRDPSAMELITLEEVTTNVERALAARRYANR